MSANVDGMVRQGIAAYKDGKIDEARAFLMRAVELDEHHEMAWLWLSGVVESDEDKQTCLENVLTINPNNEKARQGLMRLTGQAATPPPPDPAPPPAKPETPAATPALSQTVADDEDEEMPTSLAWDIPATETSSASSQRPINEPSGSDYDEWVANLGIGSSSSAEVFGEVAADIEIESSSFSDDSFPFMEDMAGSAADNTTSNAMFGGPFDTGGFDAVDDLDSAFDEFEESDSEPDPSSAPAYDPATAGMRSPVEESTRQGFYDATDEDEDDEDERFTTSYGGYDDDEVDDDNEYEPQASEEEDPFANIPQGITATRLPGSNERYPAWVIVGLIILMLGNIGAIALLVMQLVGAL